MHMENSNFEQLVEHVKQYVETRVQLAKLDTAAGVSAAVSYFVRVGVLFLTLLIVIVFAGCGAALLVGQLMGNVAYGYLIIAGAYLVAGIVFYVINHKWLKVKVTQEVLNRFSDDKQ